ncbi:MAG: transglutaminase domain-containing protein [Nitrospirae bacterium]|nr:transglutaminase domain-containing protein [Nitrospirota bacterium]
MNIVKTALTALLLSCGIICVPAISHAKERQGTVTVQVNLNAPADSKNVRLWIPYPMSDKNQDITGINFTGNYASVGVYKDPQSKSGILYAEWKEPSKERVLTYTFNAKRKEILSANLPKKEMPLSKEEFRAYLDNSWLGATEAKIKKEAEKITKGKKTVLAKARAIYDWVLDNMRRDPNAKACGLCDVERLLTERMGKCADVHTVFVSLCRAAGVPARDIWGIRMPKAKEGDMTKMQHCWAEFYLPGHGWLPVDAADVHKIVFDKKLSSEDAKKLKERDYFFGSVEENRIQLGYAYGMLNPPQSGAPIIYFMYPYAEADGKTVGEELVGYNFGYKISFREL